MHLNHPETIHPAPWPVEKLSSTKQVPGAKKAEDHWCKSCAFSSGLALRELRVHIYLVFGGIYLVLKCSMAILSTFFFFLIFEDFFGFAIFRLILAPFYPRDM